MLRKIAMTVTALGILSTTIPVQASTWFEVEMFIFERQNNSTEQWPDTPAAKVDNRAIDFITPLISTDITGVAASLNGCTSNDWSLAQQSDCGDNLTSSKVRSHPSQVPFSIAATQPNKAYLGDGPTLLAQSQSQFADIIKTVSRESNIKPLIHLTWQQNMQGRRNAKPVRIFAGKDFSNEYDYHGQRVTTQKNNQPSIDLTVNEFASLGNLFETEQTKPVWELDGTINIYLSHYLYIENNFALRKETQKMLETNKTEFNQYDALNTQVEKSMQPYLQAIPLKQNRRVRSGELHYFDHPKMGIVMQIRKMEQPTMARPIDLGEKSATHSQNQQIESQTYLP
ncbi:peptidoglycan binding protein CsiV [Shewanella aestuarii]|uniref:Peptidoglycan-binding protein n=1 Tax=Shewanella aestuarii TaxID=1028752 RepID=A0A6G9QJU1_9GAMM|nr:peptidoglycan binding protein CsiV [Shewanella aestuarii]QIR14742.1 hypothetical protein HBH39_09785 [Shewanella aestuarii]